MRKLVLVLIMMILFLLGTCHVYALDISIDEIKVLDKSNNIIVNSITSEGLTFIPSITFNNVDDYITFKIFLKGNNLSNYKISGINDNNISTYIKTTYKYNETIDQPIYVTLLYNRASGTDTTIDNIAINISIISNGNEVVVTNNQNNDVKQNTSSNPQTGLFLYIIIPIVLIIFSIFVIRYYMHHQNNITSIILILCLILIPFTAFAIEGQTISLTLNTSNIVIKGVQVEKETINNSEDENEDNAEENNDNEKEIVSNVIGQGSGGARNCSGSYVGQKYSLTNTQKQKIAGMIYSEYGYDLNGMKAVASQMANLYEINSYNDSNCTRNRSFYEYITDTGQCGWYASADNPSSTNADALRAVEDVIINGNRTLPLYIDEFDMFPGDIVGASSISDSNSYQPGVTKISNKYGSSGTYYCITKSGSGANIYFYTAKGESYRVAKGYSKGY